MLKEQIINTLRSTNKLTDNIKYHLYASDSSCIINYTSNIGTIKKPAGRCLRALFLAYIGISKVYNKDDNKIIYSDINKTVNEEIINHLLATIDITNSIVDRDVTYKISDILVKDRLKAVVDIDKEYYGIDIRTTTVNRYIQEPEKQYPKIEHLIQYFPAIYTLKNTIKKFILLYYIKNTGDVLEYMIEPVYLNKDIFLVVNGKIIEHISWNSILARFHDITMYINIDILPPKDYIVEYDIDTVKKYVEYGMLDKGAIKKYTVEKFGDIECQLCGYKDICNKE